MILQLVRNLYDFCVVFMVFVVFVVYVVLYLYVCIMCDV
jgi:hypothetical protein